MAIKSSNDPNKPAVYNAENAWQQVSRTAGQELTGRQARLLSKQILNHPSLDDVPGVAKARKALLPKISLKTRLVEKVAPGTTAATNGLGMTLYNPKYPITAGTVAHETTHKIRAFSGEDDGHGPEFTNTHRAVVRAAFGANAEQALTKHYNKHGAK